ncbi:hypothetical protein VNO77_14515 [Canavalia gladiata]|uniref:Uncharacterized protein n=1 Tax=Canavalia gladiata TaxID=3824 RepID=A0AAN9LYT9_CANGL
MDSYEKTCLRYAYFACGIVTTYTPGPWVQLLLPSSFRLKFQKSEEFSFLFGSIWHAFVTNSECLEQRHEIPGRSKGTGFPRERTPFVVFRPFQQSPVRLIGEMLTLVSLYPINATKFNHEYGLYVTGLMLKRIPRNAIRFQLGEKQRNLVNLAVAVRLPFCFGKNFLTPVLYPSLSIYIPYPSSDGAFLILGSPTMAEVVEAYPN